MQDIVHNINLNLSQPNNFEYIHVMQGDYNSEKVVATLFNGNKLYTVDAQKATLQGSTSDGGLILQNNIEISEDKHQVIFEITKEMSSCPGELTCNIVFSSNNQKKSTFPFIIKNTADITGRAPVSVLTTISDYVDRAEKAASDAEKTLKDKADKDHKHTKSDITDFPTLGTASSKDVPSSGNASTTQVVMGNDTRLTDARKASDVSAWAKSSVKPSYSKSEVGLGNVDNTSDTNKPVSTAQQTAIDTAYANANKYTDKKVADLIGSAPETMDTLEEVAAAIQENKDVETALNAAIGTKANQTELDTHTGNSTIHITASERTKWNAAKTHADSTHARTDATKVEASTTNGNIKINGTETTVYTHPSGTNPHGTTKSDVGLGNVGNFKAVSTVASQGLSDTEKSNARANIGAGTSSFSGSYNDLSNKPTIPTVGNGTITIKQAGTSKGTFTMNQSGNTTIELTDNNTTYVVATSSALGLVKSGTDITVDSSGNVSVNDDSHNHVISNVDGLQSALDGKSDSSHTHSEYVNQNAFSNVTVGSTTVSADSVTDTLTLVAGSNITITPDVTNDKITIESTASGGSYVGSSAPSDTNLLWIDTSNSGILKYYDGTKWVEIAGLAEILDSMQSYLTRAQALYDSMYLDCDGETPNLRVVTLIKIKGGTPQQRLIDGGISFDGGTPTSRLLGA